jgi:hypothetical protein
MVVEGSAAVAGRGRQGRRPLKLASGSAGVYRAPPASRSAGVYLSACPGRWALIGIENNHAGRSGYRCLALSCRPCIVQGRRSGRLRRCCTSAAAAPPPPPPPPAAALCSTHLQDASSLFRRPFSLCRAAMWVRAPASRRASSSSCPQHASRNSAVSSPPDRWPGVAARPPAHGVCASRSGGGASDSRALPEYSPRPACDGGGH